MLSSWPDDRSISIFKDSVFLFEMTTDARSYISEKKTVVRTRKHSRLTCIDSRVGRMNGNPELQITKTVL